MSPLYLAIKNCLFSVEKKALYLQKRRRQFYREKNESTPKLTKTYLMDGFEDFIVKEKAGSLIEDRLLSKALALLPYVLLLYLLINVLRRVFV